MFLMKELNHELRHCAYESLSSLFEMFDKVWHFINSTFMITLIECRSYDVTL